MRTAERLARLVARRIRDVALRIKPFTCPDELRRHHRHASPDAERRICVSLKEHYFNYPAYFPDPVDQYLSTADGKGDMQQHLFDRLENNRQTVVPWIVAAVGTLRGKAVLEIGCGTGSSTVALVEQGATVLASDVHDGSLCVAAERLACYGLNTTLLNMDATKLFGSFTDEQFDAIAFLAVLEHMTLDERLSALRNAWARLKPGGHLIVDETPNRLWYVDNHTALEPFFLWLPDELAARYSSRTPRRRYNQLFAEGLPDVTAFARWGRGVSYHDFVLALNCDPNALPVTSCKELFLREKTGMKRGFSHTPWRRYEEFIRALAPGVHRGFFLPWLDLILRKPG